MSEKVALEQTKNLFKFKGKVTRIDKDNAYKEDVLANGAHKGKTYRSLRFGVKTSETNEMTVQMFDFEPEEVFLWNSEKAKKEKEKGGKYKGEKIAFAKWLKQEDKLREKGYASLQSRVGLEYGEDKKLISHGMPSFVASELIYDNLDNGDDVIIEGEIRYSTYKNQQDRVVEQKQYNIKKIHRVKDIDFEDEKFEEVSYFEQEFVYLDAEKEKDEQKVYVSGRIIAYGGKWHDTQFVVDYSDGEGGTDENMVTLAEAFLKTFKFGDLLKVFGDTVNRVELGEAEDDDEDETEEEKLLKSLGGKKKPKHTDKFTVKNYITEAQIHGVEEWTKGKYEEDDFVSQELIEEDEEDDKDKKELASLGGKKKKKVVVEDDEDDENPFADTDEDDLEIEDDDLPF